VAVDIAHLVGGDARVTQGYLHAAGGAFAAGGGGGGVVRVCVKMVYMSLLVCTCRVYRAWYCGFDTWMIEQNQSFAVKQ